MPEQTSGLQVEIDRDTCMGLGMCIVYAPKAFVHDGETKAVFTGVGKDSDDDLRAAVESCPTGALSLISPS